MAEALLEAQSEANRSDSVRRFSHCENLRGAG
jgi:hypothetical protein